MSHGNEQRARRGDIAFITMPPEIRARYAALGDEPPAPKRGDNPQLDAALDALEALNRDSEEPVPVQQIDATRGVGNAGAYAAAVAPPAESGSPSEIALAGIAVDSATAGGGKAEESPVDASHAGPWATAGLALPIAERELHSAYVASDAANATERVTVTRGHQHGGRLAKVVAAIVATVAVGIVGVVSMRSAATGAASSSGSASVVVPPPVVETATAGVPAPAVAKDNVDASTGAASVATSVTTPAPSRAGDRHSASPIVDPPKTAAAGAPPKLPPAATVSIHPPPSVPTSGAFEPVPPY